MTSSRAITHATGQFVRETAGSQALERGLSLLRAFRVGTTSLTNAGLAEKVGLPRATVSRLTRSLVDSGFLCYDVSERAYRLSSVVLSLSDAYGQAHQAPEFARPFMRKLGSAENVNVGLAVADQTDMVYLVAVRQSRDALSRLRRVVAGTRVPIAMTSIGFAYLAGLPQAAREALLHNVALREGKQWPSIRARVASGIAEMQALGYCTAAFQPGHLLAVGSHFVGPDNQLYAVNISYPFRSGHESSDNRRYGAALLKLIASIRKDWFSTYERKGIAVGRSPGGAD